MLSPVARPARLTGNPLALAMGKLNGIIAAEIPGGLDSILATSTTYYSISGK
jgi:hypothetical protein